MQKGEDSEIEVRAAGMASWTRWVPLGWSTWSVFCVYHCWPGSGELTNKTVSLEAARYEEVTAGQSGEGTHLKAADLGQPQAPVLAGCCLGI